MSFDFSLLNAPFELSYDQKQIINYTLDNPTENITVVAVAGSGKTTLLAYLAKALKIINPESLVIASTSSRTLADDMTNRIQGADCSTVHAWAYRVVRQYAKDNKIRAPYVKNKLPLYKAIDKAREVFNIPKDKEPGPNIYSEFWSLARQVSEVADRIRTHLLHKESPLSISQWHAAKGIICSPQTAQYALQVVDEMTEHFRKTGQLDFTGQMFLLHAIDMKRYSRVADHVLADETQDLSRLQISMYHKMCGKKAQVVAVGDPNQSIYHFHLLEINAYQRFRQTFTCKEFSYNRSYRIPHSMSKWLNESGIDTSINVPKEAKKGTIEYLNYHKFLVYAEPNSYVLTRYNRGNRASHVGEKISLDLLALGKAAILKGSDYMKCIYEGVSLLRGTGVNFSNKSIKELTSDEVDINEAHTHVHAAIQSQITALEKLQRTPKKLIKELERTATIFDMYFKFYIRKSSRKNRTMKHFISFCKDIYTNKDGSAITVLSIHRAKGLENNTVYLFDVDELVNNVNDSTLSYEQRVDNRNLLYVALTRASEKTYIVAGGTLPTRVDEIKENNNAIL